MTESLQLDQARCLRSHGVTVPYDPAIITPPIAAALRAGCYEAEEAEQIPSIVEPGDVVVEIGAGIGFISTLVARQPCLAKVFAFEANPALIPFMAKLHAQNGVTGVERVNAVLCNTADTSARFYQRRDFWMGSLAPGPEPYVAAISVPVINLNDFLAREAVSLIICDIEGAEKWLFGDADLASVNRIYVELHDHITGLGGIAALFEHMGARGFAYDPRHSCGAVVLFRRVAENEVLRAFSGKTDA
ncbi:MAG: FkbM family methyltransferase [Paracoccaceae bacterium]